MGACGSKSKKRKSTSDLLLENRLKQDAFVIKQSHTTANGYQNTSTMVVRTSVQNNRVLMQHGATAHQPTNGHCQLPIGATVLAAGKYDLSKKAYVLVFHHNRFDNSILNRPGSQKDMEKIHFFFRNYRVDPLNVNENQTAAKVREIMNAIARQNFSNNSCLITIIMSHGLVNDQIMAYDDKTYCFEDDIVEKCTSNRTLDGKPKLFIVQACRGKSIVATDSKEIRCNKNDVLIFQSTYKGFVALRDTQNGTFFIQNFFKLLDEHRNKDISYINKQLNQIQSSQNPTMSSTLRGNLIFGELRK